MRIAVKIPVLGYTGSQLMGTNEVRIRHDQMLWKPGLGATGEPALSNNIGWHQDYAHWQYANTMNFCTAWVALQDIDESNDSMRLMADASSGRGESEIP